MPTQARDPSSGAHSRSVHATVLEVLREHSALGLLIPFLESSVLATQNYKSPYPVATQSAVVYVARVQHFKRPFRALETGLLFIANCEVELPDSLPPRQMLAVKPTALGKPCSRVAGRVGGRRKGRGFVGARVYTGALGSERACSIRWLGLMGMARVQTPKRFAVASWPRAMPSTRKGSTIHGPRRPPQSIWMRSRSRTPA